MPLQTKLVQIPDLLLDLLFPRFCVGCGTEGDFLCGSCIETLPHLQLPFCDRCGLPIPENSICPDCQNLPLTIDGIRSLYLHEGLAREAIHSLKYKNMKALAKPLAALMSNYFKANPFEIDTLLAAPMHAKRLRTRGYNQPELLAHELSHLTGLYFAKDSLIRTKNTTSQVSLSADDRRNNVNGAFQCKDGFFRDRKVLLIDDVCTTGATLNACAIALKEGGAASVWGLTLSREC